MGLFGLSREEIDRAREFEDIIQFTCRGALRNPASNDDYHVYLYDLHQAETLAQYLTDQGLSTVELVAVEDAGLLDKCRRRRGRPSAEPENPRSPKERTDERRAKDNERQKRKRHREKEAKLLTGTYRGRGRPKKA